MQIKGVEWVSWVDYPGPNLHYGFFYDGCNLRCPFCHNALLVWESTALPPVDQAELLKKLGERRELVQRCVLAEANLLCHRDYLILL